jgi:O-antigen/teichoic acid export membrane protein
VVASRGVALTTTVLSVQWSLAYLGAERYGMWMTISSIIAVLAFADLGVGSSLVNAIAAAEGRGDRDAIRAAVSSSFFLLAGIAAAMLAGFFAIYPWAPWPRLFNVTSQIAAAEAGPAMAVFATCFALSMPLDLVQRVQMGHQEMYHNHLWQSAGHLLGLAMVLLAIRLQAGLPWLVLALAGSPLVAMGLNGCLLFGWQRPWLWPRLSCVGRSSIKSLAGSGLLFLVLQIFTLLGNSTDNLVIAHVNGAAEVAPYSIVQRMFSIALLAQAFVTPLWPAFGEAIARRDFQWARTALRRALLLSLTLGAATAIPLAACGKMIVELWTGPEMVPSWTLLAGFAAWVLLVCYGGVMSAFLNSGPLLGKQTLFIGCAALAALALKFLLAWQIGPAAVIWATVIAYWTIYAYPAWRLAFGGMPSTTPAATHPPQLGACPLVSRGLATLFVCPPSGGEPFADSNASSPPEGGTTNEVRKTHTERACYTDAQ